MPRKDTAQQAAAFDAIGEKYDEIFSNKDTQARVTQWLAGQLEPGARVLDIGCGTGVPTARMLAEAGMEVLGIDISKEMLRLARRNVPRARFEQVDVMDFTAEPGSFHAATAFFSLLMLPRADIPGALRSITRALRPGGYLLLSMVEGDFDYIELPFIGNVLHVTAYPQSQLEALLRDAGLSVLEMEAVDFTPAPGAPPERQLYYRCRKGTEAPAP